MKAVFLGRIESNHTAFIRIKTNKEEQENVLVLPVEVEVNEGEFNNYRYIQVVAYRYCPVSL